jgi:hypothetical protein
LYYYLQYHVIFNYVLFLFCNSLFIFNFRSQKMVCGSLHRSCSSAYRRLTGKGGSSKGKAKKRRARREEEEEHEEEEPAQAEPAREEPAQEEQPPQDTDYELEAEEASGGARGERH